MASGLPVYFPRGDLSATPGVPRVRVRTRLTVIFLLVSVLPLTVLGVLAYTRASALIGADARTAAARLEGLLLFILFMLVVGGLVAVGLSIFVSRSVAGPLREVEAAMREVNGATFRPTARWSATTRSGRWRRASTAWWAACASAT